MKKVEFQTQVCTRDSASRIQPALSDLMCLVLAVLTMPGRMTTIPTRGLLTWILPGWLELLGELSLPISYSSVDFDFQGSQNSGAVILNPRRLYFRLDSSPSCRSKSIMEVC